MIRLEIRHYITETEKCPFQDWMDGLKDKRGAGLIAVRLNRVSLGNMGDCKALGDNIFELRIFHGPGYRVYFGMDGKKIVIILSGGSKATQSRDIERAKTYWGDYLRRRDG